MLGKERTGALWGGHLPTSLENWPLASLTILHGHQGKLFSLAHTRLFRLSLRAGALWPPGKNVSESG